MYYLDIEISPDIQIKASEITNKIFFNTCQAAANRSDKNFADYFENQLKQLILEGSYNRFTKIEKFIVFLEIYKLSVSDSINFISKNKEDKNVNVSLMLDIVINNLKKINNDVFSIIPLEGVRIKIGPPKKIYAGSLDDLLIDLITEIDFENVTYFFQDMSESEQTSLLNSLTGPYISKCQNAVQEMHRTTTDIMFIDSTDISMEYPVSLFDNSIFAFIKLLCTYDESQYYEELVAFIKHIGGSVDGFENLTPKAYHKIVRIYSENQKRDTPELNL